MLHVAKTMAIACTVAEVAMIPALIGLEIASGYRAGIMHHLYFQKRHYLATLYQESALIYHLLGVAVSVGMILFFCRTRWRIVGKTVFIRYGCALAALVLCSLLPWFAQLNTFAHLLIALECCLAIETIRLLMLLRTRLRLLATEPLNP